jgi:hypothetical protein
MRLSRGHSALLAATSIVFMAARHCQALPDYWQVRRSPVASDLRAVTSGNGILVAVGSEQTILTSSNGSDWTVRSHRPGSADSFHAVTYSQGTFVAVGTGEAFLCTSTDGANWRNSLAAYNEWQTRHGVASREGLFIAAGRAPYEDSGSSEFTIGVAGHDEWRTFTLFEAPNTIRAITYGADQFVAVGDAGTIVVSSNGLTWTSRDSGVTENLLSVVYTGSKFIASGEQDHVVLASADGSNWAPAAPSSFVIRGLAYGRGAVVAVGSFSSAGRIHASPDGMTWPGSSREAPYPLHGVTYSGGYFVAVGDRGLIMQSSVPRLIAGRTNISQHVFITLTVEAEVGRLYRLDFSPDFERWTTLTYVLQREPQHMIGAINTQAGYPNGFYRVALYP